MDIAERTDVVGANGTGFRTIVDQDGCEEKNRGFNGGRVSKCAESN